MKNNNNLIQLKNAMNNLYKAWNECELAFDLVENINDYICNNGEYDEFDYYPFHLSFNDMNVATWIEECLIKIDRKLNSK